MERIAFLIEVTLKVKLRHGDRRQMFFGVSETQNVFDLSGRSRTVNVNFW